MAQTDDISSYIDQVIAQLVRDDVIQSAFQRAKIRDVIIDAVIAGGVDRTLMHEAMALCDKDETAA